MSLGAKGLSVGQKVIKFDSTSLVVLLFFVTHFHTDCCNAHFKLIKIDPYAGRLGAWNSGGVTPPLLNPVEMNAQCRELWKKKTPSFLWLLRHPFSFNSCGYDVTKMSIYLSSWHRKLQTAALCGEWQPYCRADSFLECPVPVSSPCIHRTFSFDSGQKKRLNVFSVLPVEALTLLTRRSIKPPVRLLCQCCQWVRSVSLEAKG